MAKTLSMDGGFQCWDTSWFAQGNTHLSREWSRKGGKLYFFIERMTERKEATDVIKRTIGGEAYIHIRFYCHLSSKGKIFSEVEGAEA